MTKKPKSEIQLEVIEKQQLSVNIVRFIFIDKSNVLEKSDESAYIKLAFIDKDSQTRLRSYTVREVDESKHRITVDFVVHGDESPASAWAINAKIGDVVTAFGPGPVKLIDTNCDWFFIAGDATSLPAIAVNLKLLPRNAKGYALLEIMDESDIQNLEKPDGVEILWLINQDHTSSPNVVLNATKALKWQQGTPYIWVASEFSVARALREYLREEKGITSNRYVSSYWKYGETDEGNKRAKKEDGGF